MTLDDEKIRCNLYILKRWKLKMDAAGINHSDLVNRLLTAYYGVYSNIDELQYKIQRAEQDISAWKQQLQDHNNNNQEEKLSKTLSEENRKNILKQWKIGNRKDIDDAFNLEWIGCKDYEGCGFKTPGDALDWLKKGGK